MAFNPGGRATLMMTSRAQKDFKRMLELYDEKKVK